MNTSLCANCNNTFSGNYCNQCGQKAFTYKDKSIHGIIGEAVHFLTHFEGKIFTTMRMVITTPGKYSLNYCSGVRQRYYKPISFFLMLILLYLLFPIMKGMNQELHFYQSNYLIGDLISSQIQHKLAETGMSFDQLSEVFAQKSEKTAKLLLLLLIPLSAGALYLLFFRRKKPAYDLLTVATEINIFVLLVFFLILPVFILFLIVIFHVPDREELFYPILLTLFAVMLTANFRRFFGEKLVFCFLKAIMFMLLYFIISQIIYKLSLFELTLLMI